MKSQQITPTEFCYNVLIETLVDQGNLFVATQYFHEFEQNHEFKHDWLFRQMMTGHSKIEDFKGTSQYYHLMLSKKIIPSSIHTYMPLFKVKFSSYSKALPTRYIPLRQLSTTFNGSLMSQSAASVTQAPSTPTTSRLYADTAATMPPSSSQRIFTPK
jgi:pentatricopeptide repeat protein